MPGRPEGPINPDASPSVRDLALRLRELREASGLSYRDLSERAPVSLPTLSRAASGRTVPSWPVVNAFADACHLEAQARQDLEALWHAAIREQQMKPIPWTPANTAAAAAQEAARQEGNDQEQLRSALTALYKAAGRPSLRHLAAESGVPRSVVHRVVTGAFKQEVPARAAEVAEVLLSLAEPGVRDAWADLLARLRTPAVHTAERSRPRPVADEAPDEARQGDARQQAQRAARRMARLTSQMAHKLANGQWVADDESVRVLRELQRGLDDALQTLSSRSRLAPDTSVEQESLFVLETSLSEAEASLEDDPDEAEITDPRGHGANTPEPNVIPGRPGTTIRALEALEALERDENSRERRSS